MEPVDAFESVIASMFAPPSGSSAGGIFDPTPWLRAADPVTTDAHLVAGVDADALAAGSGTATLTAAFLVALGGASQPDHERAVARLDHPLAGAPDGLATFYRRALDLVHDEVRRVAATDSDLSSRLTETARAIGALLASASGPDTAAYAEALWPLFFPEGVGIRGHEAAREATLRRARTVTLDTLNPAPITDPGREVLFTSNVLLTLPAASRPIHQLPYSAAFRRDLEAAAGEGQLHWYDHPIQIGVEAEANELLYGLRELDEAVDFERRRVSDDGRVACVMSVSVTHAGLQGLARPYVEAELARSGGLRHLDVHVFTEGDTMRLVDEVLAPAAIHLADDSTLTGNRTLAGDRPDHSATRAMLGEVFGVDGAYGRHYSFLKAIAALWQVLIDPAVRGTFKIDLDQIFPQAALVAETGASAFEHLTTPLWGARGRDARGGEIDLGMIAGALVNERDIDRGVFTPDVDYPTRFEPDQAIFCSALPQALSTRAEMMERDPSWERDGRSACLERVHVTGGTNGILVDALRRHRPFTPSFIGRAEDQAYILSTLGRPGPRLGYAHAAGLIMRHDKEAFAGEAIAAAEAGKLVGDDVRILHFSAYAEVIGRDGVKALIDPFTGCFVSRLPITLCLLRFALRIARTVQLGRTQLAVELAEVGVARLGEALRFTGGDRLRQTVERERRAWALYYDALDGLEAGLRAGDQTAVEQRRRAVEIIAKTAVGGHNG